MVSTLSAVVSTHLGTRCAFAICLSHTDRMKIIKIFWPGMGDCRLGGALCFVSWCRYRCRHRQECLEVTTRSMQANVVAVVVVVV